MSLSKRTFFTPPPLKLEYRNAKAILTVVHANGQHSAHSLSLAVPLDNDDAGWFTRIRVPIREFRKHLKQFDMTIQMVVSCTVLATLADGSENILSFHPLDI